MISYQRFNYLNSSYDKENFAAQTARQSDDPVIFATYNLLLNINVTKYDTNV